jgi:hypothetical protein
MFTREDIKGIKKLAADNEVKRLERQGMRRNEIDYAEILYKDTNYKDRLLRFYHSNKWSFPVYGVDLIQNNKLYNLSNRFPFSINEPMMVLYKYGNPCSLINYKGMDIKNLNNYILNLNSCSFNNFTCN